MKRTKGNPTGALPADAEPGHNSGDDVTTTTQTVAAGQLRSLLERIERLMEEKKTIADDIRDVYAEAKGTGFDTPTMRMLIKLRNMDQAEREEKEALLDLYKSSLGMA